MRRVVASLIFNPILLLGAIDGKKLNTAISIGGFQTINIVITRVSRLVLIFRS